MHLSMQKFFCVLHLHALLKNSHTEQEYWYMKISAPFYVCCVYPEMLQLYLKPDKLKLQLISLTTTELWHFKMRQNLLQLSHAKINGAKITM